MSEKRIWATESAPGAELEYWRAATCEAVFDIEIKPFDENVSLDATIVQQSLGPIRLSQISVGFGQVINRTSAAIRRSKFDQFELVYIMGGNAFLCQCGRETEINPGDCILVNGQEKYTLTTSAGSRNLSFHLPTGWLKQWLACPEEHAAMPISGGKAWGRALVAAMEAIDDNVNDNTSSLCADQIGGALALALTKQDDRQISQHRLRHFHRLRQTLADLAYDNTLDAKKVAQMHGDCQDFRVWAGIMGKKETHYVPTQGAVDSG
ncbi:AraC family ligand binding domain-containing protein [Sphingobium fluviale]|uniref:Transcription regulator HTH AraC- type ligand binding domain-containing protein n=1 Tax=Sphingobium fluviale TaxID=2506423 RepID=A0A4Q1K9G3_9SPHN|nr:AraC family ligand binding domain-containing protein [Sphingobium fluviale]RXR23093.1 hypothetical protein EQG66_15150 [Sphingobium fluviale]